MRLIDADALRWAIRENAPKSVPLWVYQTIDKQPIAYNVDEIVREIEQLRVQYFITIAGTGDKALDVAYEKVYQALDKAIEIVKAGGKHDK